ncbi:MAG: hypothetical protein KGL25_12920 [Gammaproteobacteria bacterium]|nr:hypothetical protein [Gammaproteobacteria bacterium]MDE2252295.1 hypothetical protein [Gammaproteobacteria bacterium]
MGARGVVARILAAQLLVLATFNPSGYSYGHWLAQGFPHVSAAQAVLGLLLVICWVVYVTATLRSLGLLGVSLLAALIAALVWLAVQNGWLHLDGGSALAWIAVVATGLILGVGMCWSFVRRRLSGQADVDEVHGH